jgi:hypothetical protein
MYALMKMGRLDSRPEARDKSLQFPLTCGIIRVCLNFAGRFRNKDTATC